MNVLKLSNYDELSHKAGNLIAAQVLMKPHCVLGFATGSSPIGTYKELINWHKAGDLSFSDVTTFNLDEYKGMAPENTQSYRFFMNHNLFDHIDINKARTFVPDGLGASDDKVCSEYTEQIRRCGGIDMQLLGIGHNGHIGFNEPAETFTCNTNCVDLSERTIEANKRFFDSAEEVPRQAYTMGILNIIQARKIVVVVNGSDKADILKQVVCGPVTPHVPASILQLHSDVTIFADEDACRQLPADRIA